MAQLVWAAYAGSVVAVAAVAAPALVGPLLGMLVVAAGVQVVMMLGGSARRDGDRVRLRWEAAPFILGAECREVWSAAPSSTPEKDPG